MDPGFEIGFPGVKCRSPAWSTFRLSCPLAEVSSICSGYGISLMVQYASIDLMTSTNCQ